MSLPAPSEIAEFLGQRVIGQPAALREMAIALSKKLAGLRAANVLLIGGSGSGKTTLMRAVEGYLAQHEELSMRSAVLRLHANVLGEEAERGRQGQAVLAGLIERAGQRFGRSAGPERILEAVAHGIVFVDEVDKIRSAVGGEPHVRGVRAQEALLTLIENEAVPVELPAWLGGGVAEIDSRGLWFVAGGAFEGLYDAVFDRVTVGEDRGALRPVTVVEAGGLREELPFRLRDWIRSADLYRYGMSPQFLSRFDSTVLLDDLNVDDLVRILLGAPESSYRAAQDFFRAYGVELALSPAAARRIAEAAVRRKRIGARALAEIFRVVIAEYEFDPRQVAAESRVLSIDVAEVDRALASEN